MYCVSGVCSDIYSMHVSHGVQLLPQKFLLLKKCNKNALIHIMCSKCVRECISQGSVEEREGMDLLARPGQAGKEQKLLSSMPYMGFQQKVWSILKVCLSRLKTQIRDVCLPTSKLNSLTSKQKSLTDVSSISGL